MAAAKAAGPANNAKALIVVMDPIVKNDANICGFNRSMGRKLSDIRMRRRPTPKTAPNLSSFLGSIAREAAPCARSPTTDSAPLAPCAAADAPSRAFCAACPELSDSADPTDAAPCDTCSRPRDTPRRRLSACSDISSVFALSMMRAVLSWNDLVPSLNDELAEEVLVETRSCITLICSLQSVLFAFSSPSLRFWRACSAASSACRRARSSAPRAQEAHCGSPSPRSRSELPAGGDALVASGTVRPSDCGTACGTAARARRTME
mmetsp:Transcript_107557/g.283625  ORF Transcript_107557/g.283625 Transcript_107557/m.283625 type:complete len:264 (-) Transcript_107557:61-852(-)